MIWAGLVLAWIGGLLCGVALTGSILKIKRSLRRPALFASLSLQHGGSVQNTPVELNLDGFEDALMAAEQWLDKHENGRASIGITRPLSDT